MKQLTAVSLAVPLFAMGCLMPQPVDEIGEAIPEAEQVRVKLPEGENTEAQLALGEISEFYGWTRGITHGVNTGAGFVLLLVHTIVQLPPTTVDGDTYTWGPGSDPLDPADYRLVVTDNANGTYNWSLDGRSKFDANAEFITVVSGLAVAGTDPDRGSGDFTLNLDNMKTLNPIEHADSNGGTAQFVYDLENRDGTQASLEMHIEAPDAEGIVRVADYRYAENEDRSGDFQFSVPVDVDENGSDLEDVILRSRWLADGAGRGDGRVSGGDAGAEVIEVSQCWNQQFRTVYEVSTHELIEEAGNAEDCAFLDQDLPDL